MLLGLLDVAHFALVLRELDLDVALIWLLDLQDCVLAGVAHFRLVDLVAALVLLVVILLDILALLWNVPPDDVVRDLECLLVLNFVRDVVETLSLLLVESACLLDQADLLIVIQVILRGLLLPLK